MREQFHIISSENQSLLGYITVLPEDNITPLMKAAMTANTGEINRQINRYHADVNQVGLTLYTCTLYLVMTIGITVISLIKAPAR